MKKALISLAVGVLLASPVLSSASVKEAAVGEVMPPVVISEKSAKMEAPVIRVACRSNPFDLRRRCR